MTRAPRLAIRLIALACLAAASASGASLQEADARALGDRAFLAAAKQRTTTLNGMVDASVKTSFPKVRVLRVPDGRRVCGEIRDDVDQVWSRFYTDVDARGAEVEHYVGHDLTLFEPFERRCSDAVRKLAPGARGSAEDIRACAAAGLASQAKLERARFDLLFTVACEEKLWPRLLTE